jgi:hypothetical protein
MRALPRALLVGSAEGLIGGGLAYCACVLLLARLEGECEAAVGAAWPPFMPPPSLPSLPRRAIALYAAGGVGLLVGAVAWSGELARALAP